MYNVYDNVAMHVPVGWNMDTATIVIMETLIIFMWFLITIFTPALETIWLLKK